MGEMRNTYKIFVIKPEGNIKDLASWYIHRYTQCRLLIMVVCLCLTFLPRYFGFIAPVSIVITNSLRDGIVH
jgi:hypothetical protein